MARVSGKAAKTYARALFELCEPAQLESMRDTLKLLGELWLGSPELQGSLHNPAVPKGERLAVARDIAARAKPEDGRLANFMALLVDNKRMSALPMIAQEFSKYIEALKKSLSLEVVSAFPLDAAECKNIEDNVRGQFGSLVTFTWIVEREILGGLMVRLGDRLLDGSIRGSLEKVAAELTA